MTGRILDHLRRDAGDLNFVDAIVGENGAVVEFPDNGYTRILGPPPPDEFVAASVKRVSRSPWGVSSSTPAQRMRRGLLAAIRRMELPLTLVFNRGRVMILPQAISKATGILEALTMMRLSAHNAVAIGDAENDHELLRVCEVGVAVEWGSPALKLAADQVLPGRGPADVGPYVYARSPRAVSSLRRATRAGTSIWGTRSTGGRCR